VAHHGILATAAATVLLGTIYPLILDTLSQGTVSVGPPYYNATFMPIILPLIAPAVDQVRPLIERRVDQMGGAGEFIGCTSTLRGVGEIERHVTRAIQLARLAPRQRDHLDGGITCEMPQGGVAHETRRTCDHDLLACHRNHSSRRRTALPSR
jgi:hypothetical protein